MSTDMHFTQILAILVLLTSNGNAFQSRHALRSSFETKFPVLDLASPEKASDTDLSYRISRGDGSTGGGGLPMPKKGQGIDSDLVRPKVKHTSV